MRYVISINEDNALNPDLTGQKFAALARAHKAGFAVPAAVAVSADAHRYFLENRVWPQGLLDEVLSAADSLGISEGLSVRSSAIREDLRDRSFAGQYSTFLHVFGKVDLKDKIGKCWESAESEALKSYLHLGDSRTEIHDIPLMGVILQRMVPAEVAGVAFSRNPLNPARDEIVIEAVDGLADRLVNGRVSPHRVFVDKAGKLRLEGSRTETSHTERPAAILTDERWREIASLLVRLEAQMQQGSLDMEWAFDDNQRLWLLQYRNITALATSDGNVPPGMWTRRIADDLWADRLTPFLAQAMTRNAPRYSLSRISRIVGIPVVEPSLAVINGYLYVNCEAIRRAVAYLPAKYRTADIRNLFPSSDDVDGIPEPSVWRFASAAMRSLLLFFLEPAVNPLVCLGWTRRRIKRIERRINLLQQMPEETAGDAFSKVIHSLEIMALIQEKNQWPYFHATFFTWLLRWLMVDCIGRSHGEFLGMIAEGGSNVSIDIERWFRKTARFIAADRQMQRAFLSKTPEDLAKSLPQPLQEEFEDFLDRYGCRARHRTLYVKRWQEAPEEVVAIIQSLVRNLEPSGHRNEGREKGGERIAPGDRAVLPFVPRLVLIAVRLMARKFLDLREELRFLLDRCLSQIRTSLLLLGEGSGLGDYVFFLDQDELKELVENKWALAAAVETARERRSNFGRRIDISTYYINGRAVENFSLSGKAFRGIGTSPGRATGRARIVRDPSRADVQKGDILIAENTDPGWTPILSLAGGLVTEEGGLLNHCSIVARELNVPAVVNVRHATRKIEEGALITIDGGQGLIRVEKSAE